MGCVTQLIAPLTLMVLGFFWTIWLVKDESEGLKVCGALTIISTGLALLPSGFVLFDLLSPHRRAEREALATYQRFEAAVRHDDYQAAWQSMCPSYRQTTTFQEFVGEEADRLAFTTGPTATLDARDRVTVGPAVWSGGAVVTLIRSEDDWCLLRLAGWSYD